MRYMLFAILILSSCFSTQSLKNIVHEDQLFIKINQATQLDIDGVGNFYVVQSDRLLHKYDKNGKKLLTYDEQSLGMIQSISCHNPLYIMVHFLESKTIVFLDRNFSVLQTINYGQWTNDDISCAEIANDNNIWLYNNTLRRLQKYNPEGMLIIESFDLYGLSQKALYIDQIKEHNNNVYLKNIEGELLILDNLARFKTDYTPKVSSPLTRSLLGIQALEQQMLGINIFNEQTRKLITVGQAPKSFSLFDGKLFGVYDNGISVIETDEID